MMAQHPDIQRRLRKELLSVLSDTPSMDDLNGLPFLDAVLRECLRLHPAVSAINRVATKDDVIPLGQPFEDKFGTLHNELPCVLLIF